MELFQNGTASLEQVVQRSCEGSNPEGIQKQVGWGLGWPGLEGGVLAHSEGIVRRSLRSLPVQTII